MPNKKNQHKFFNPEFKENDANIENMQKVENNLYIDADLAMGCVGKQTEKGKKKSVKEMCRV